MFGEFIYGLLLVIFMIYMVGAGLMYVVTDIVPFPILMITPAVLLVLYLNIN
jgi:hypothetical protein